MARATLSLILLLFVTTAIAKPPPLNLDWEKRHKDYPLVENYRYYFGDVQWGKIVYFGTKDIAGLVTELHLDFQAGKIAKASLLLGPTGLSEHNCIKKYKKIIELFNYKYGNYNFQRVEKDPLMDDLLHVSICYPMQLGLYSVDTFWNSGNYSIVVSVFGDEDGLYIEVEYNSLID